jgi:hypothetical protein
MAQVFLVGATTSRVRVDNNNQVQASGTKAGELYTCDWITALALEGRVFQASHGTVTTPITFVAYDADRPDFALDVPLGSAAIITRIQVYLEDSAGTDTEIIVTTSDNNCGASTSTALTAISTRRNGGQSAGCKAYGTYAANCTLPTNTLEFYRWGNAFADTIGLGRNFEWKISDGNPQILVGTASLQIHVSATSTQAAGFIKVTWADLLASQV